MESGHPFLIVRREIIPDYKCNKFGKDFKEMYFCTSNYITMDFVI